MWKVMGDRGGDDGQVDLGVARSLVVVERRGAPVKADEDVHECSAGLMSDANHPDAVVQQRRPRGRSGAHARAQLGLQRLSVQPGVVPLGGLIVVEENAQQRGPVTSGLPARGRALLPPPHRQHRPQALVRLRIETHLREGGDVAPLEEAAVIAPYR